MIGGSGDSLVIKTHGLTHVALLVKDPEVSLLFYESFFGVKEYVRDESCIQALGPGAHDVIAFVKSASHRLRGCIWRRDTETR